MAKCNWNWLTTRGVAGRLSKAVHEFHAARRVASHARRAAAYGVCCALSHSELKAWFSEQPKQCFWCGIDGGDDWHIDHFVPMSKGGPHHQDNLVISCPGCNLSKNDSDPIVFAASRGVAPDLVRYERVASIVGGVDVLRNSARPIVFRLECENGIVLEGCKDFELAVSVLLPIHKANHGDGGCNFVVAGRKGDVGETWRVLVSRDGCGWLRKDDCRFRLIELPSVQKKMQVQVDGARARLLEEVEKARAHQIAGLVASAEKRGGKFPLNTQELFLLKKYGFSLCGGVG